MMVALNFAQFRLNLQVFSIELFVLFQFEEQWTDASEFFNIKNPSVFVMDDASPGCKRSSIIRIRYSKTQIADANWSGNFSVYLVNVRFWNSVRNDV